MTKDAQSEASSGCKRVVGVIGGSGIYDLPGLANLREVAVETPFGRPSSVLRIGDIGDTRMVFLARHGEGHTLLPHEINYRANIYALKEQGVQWLISLSAVGSMTEQIRPGDVVIVDQYIDRTHGRVSTFFGDGIAAHVSFGTPVSPILADAVFQAARQLAESMERDLRVHKNGTYVCINGPQFSTKAESKMYRAHGVDVIGMTNMPEAKLAREAEISYCTVALSTDYDCWHESEEEVTVDAVLTTLKHNADFAKALIAAVPSRLPDTHECIAANALASAIITQPHAIPEAAKTRVAAILAGRL